MTANKTVSATDSVMFCSVTLPKVTERKYREKEVIFSQGDTANALFSVRGGRIKLMVTDEDRKGAVLRVMGAREVFGEGCLTNRRIRTATAVALKPSTVTQLPRGSVLRAIGQDPGFTRELVAYLLTCVERAETELADQILHSSEIRLARTLLEMSGVRPGSTQARTLDAIDQKTLAEMVGTTRSRVNYFMNRFRKLGLIDYNGSIHVYPALLEFLNRQ